MILLAWASSLFFVFAYSRRQESVGFCHWCRTFSSGSSPSTFQNEIIVDRKRRTYPTKIRLLAIRPADSKSQTYFFAFLLEPSFLSSGCITREPLHQHGHLRRLKEPTYFSPLGPSLRIILALALALALW
jgi:hypothetical protein